MWSGFGFNDLRGFVFKRTSREMIEKRILVGIREIFMIFNDLFKFVNL